MLAVLALLVLACAVLSMLGLAVLSVLGLTVLLAVALMRVGGLGCGRGGDHERDRGKKRLHFAVSSRID